MSFLLTGPNAISSLLFFGLSIPTLPIATEYKAKQSISDVTLIIGSSLKIDARHSIGANQSPPKYYYWRFSAVPIGSLGACISRPPVIKEYPFIVPYKSIEIHMTFFKLS